MTRTEAEQVVRERWNRLKLDPDAAPKTFRNDVDLTLGCTCIVFYDGSPHHPTCPLSDYRKQARESGRSVPQYSDPAQVGAARPQKEAEEMKMAEATTIHTNAPAQVDEYRCEDCGGLFVMLVNEKPSYCPHCGESIDL